jgi:hypothetical protein
MARIPLHDRNGDVIAHAIVDDGDYERVAKHRWGLGSVHGYVVRQRREGRSGTVRLHREVLGLKPGDPEVDHENGDKLDNRRENLRLVTKSANMQNRHGLDGKNTSGYRGVSWDRRLCKWRAQTMLRGRYHHLGYFDTPEQANDVVVAWRAENMPFSEDARKVTQ